MKKCLFIILILSFICSVGAEDLTIITEKLLPAGLLELSELSDLENNLRSQASLTEDKQFLLGKTLFLKEKIKAEKAGASEVNTPHLYTNGEYTSKAALLIHGFTASPWEMDDLGKFLQKQGINAYAVRLAGHGTKEEDLLKIKWQDWYQSAEAGLEVTKLLGKEVYVIGFSMGGTLAVILAAEYDQEIKSTITLAPALFLQDWRSSFAGIGRYFLKYNLRPLKEEFKPYYYEKRAVSAIWELVKLMKYAQKKAVAVPTPLLIMQSDTDKVVKPKSAQYLFDQVKSKDKKLIWLENAPHVLTTFENPEQNKVFQLIQDYLQVH